LTRFWSTDRGLSIFSALLLVAVFVLPPLLPPRSGRNHFADVVFSLLLIAGVRAMSERRLARVILTPVAAITIAVLFASWVTPLGTSWVELASLLSLVLLFLIVLGQTFRSGPVTFHRIQGAVAGYVLLGVIWAVAYFLVEHLRPGAFSGPVRVEDGARSWLYFSFVTLTTVGYGDVLPVHPIARSLAVLEAVIGPLYLAILLARLVSLAVTPGPGREPG
jgi:Ion channel